MRKSMKGLLAGWVVGLIPLSVQAAENDAWLNPLEPILEEINENSVYTKTGTIACTDSSVTLAWSLEEKADYGYRIFVKKADRFVKVGETGPGENRFFLDEIKGKPLEPGTSYTVKVVALKQKGRRKKVVCYRMIRTATMPETPEIISTKRKAGKKALVRWKRLANISGYELQVRTDLQADFKTVDYFGSNKSKTILRKIKQRKNYYIRIRAYKTVTGGRVYGEWSEVKKI